MHTAHLILVKADDHQDAIDTVRGNLYTDEGSNFAPWSDWSVVGEEGRFSFTHEYEGWDGASGHAVSLDDEADLFYKVLGDFKTYREREFQTRRQQVEDFSISSFTLDQDDMDSYHLMKFAELVEGRYTYDSAYYDLKNYTTSLKYFEEDVAQDGKDWFGVLVDFHF